MINIKIKNNDLIIEDKTKNIFNWNHRAFFNISLGFEVDEKNDCYFYANKNEFQGVIKEVTNYLKDEKIEFTTNQYVSDLISNIQNQDIEFREVRENLNKKPFTPKSVSLKREL